MIYVRPADRIYAIRLGTDYYYAGDCMSIVNIVSLLGGLAMFLYGVSLMGDGLGKVAGDKLQVVLYNLTSNPLKGILLGAGVTALIQSSTATSVMVIGFVNTGLMAFSQAVCVILGSIVGTSITGWIVSLSSLGGDTGWTSFFSTAFITGMMAIIGIVMLKFSRNASLNKVGTILLGFAVLMFGMGTMSDSVTPLRESESFISLLTSFSNPVLGILVGIAFTAIIQSSAAAIGILQALSMTGALTFATALPITLGVAVGGALPVLISATGASLNARRTALVHLIIDILGAAFCGIVFYALNAVLHFGFVDMKMNPVTVALLNTAFRVVTVAVLAPMISVLERIVCKFIPDEPAGKATPWSILEDRFIQHPALAVEQCRIAISNMAERVKEDMLLSFELLHNYDAETFDQVVEIENEVDGYEDNLGTYIVKVTAAELTQKQNEDVYRFLHAITDLERISDYAVNIAEVASELSGRGIVLEDKVQEEARVMEHALSEVVDNAVRALVNSDEEAARRVEPLEELIDGLCDEMTHRHVVRVQRHVYSHKDSLLLNDLIMYFERISDHCSNIAVALIELDQDEFDVHNYIESLKQRNDEEFDRCFEEYRRKYYLPAVS